MDKSNEQEEPTVQVKPKAKEKPLTKNRNFSFKITSCYNALTEVAIRRTTWLLHMNIMFLPASILS